MRGFASRFPSGKARAVQIDGPGQARSLPFLSFASTLSNIPDRFPFGCAEIGQCSLMEHAAVTTSVSHLHLLLHRNRFAGIDLGRYLLTRTVWHPDCFRERFDSLRAGIDSAAPSPGDVGLTSRQGALHDFLSPLVAGAVRGGLCLPARRAGLLPGTRPENQGRRQGEVHGQSRRCRTGRTEEVAYGGAEGTRGRQAVVRQRREGLRGDQASCRGGARPRRRKPPRMSARSARTSAPRRGRPRRNRRRPMN